MDNGLFSMFSLENIQLNTNACKNYLNKDVVCQACVESCPTKAIKLVDRLPTINHSKCTNCGLCISSCEVLAFDNIQKPYSDIHKQITDYPNSNITCDNASNHLKGIKVPCYLNIDIYMLMHLSTYRDTVDFYLGDCPSCLRSDLDTVKDHILNLQNQLNELLVPLTIQVYSTKLDERNSEVINGLTRRELFQKISLTRFRNFKFTEEVDLEKNKTNKSLFREKNLFKRRLLNRYFKKREIKLLDAKLIKKQFTTIRISDSCNGCNICEKVCPTGAVSWKDSTGSSSLVFNSHSCISCMKCNICPESAITFDSISIYDYLDAKEQTLTTFNLVKCKDCGEIFRTNNNENLCSLCEKKIKQKKVNYFG
ncbi:MAG: 4Fe-4S dicluster domain-containing protein [Vulcanibacillus sp.]